MPDTLQRLSDRLYDSLLQPTEWALALDAVRKDLDGAAFHLMQVRKSDQQVMGSLTNAEAPPEKQQEYGAQWVHLDPRMGMAMQTPFGHIVCDHDYLSKAEMDHHPVYTEFLMPIGYRHSLAIPVYDDGHTREILAFLGHHDHGPFGSPHRVLAEQLTPDLQRVARLRARMAPLTEAMAQEQSAWKALQALPNAVILVDAQCRIHYANPAAERMLHEATAGPTVKKSERCPETADWQLRTHRGKLECRSPQAQSAMETLVHAACANRLALPVSHQIGSFWLSPTVPGQRKHTMANIFPLQQAFEAGASQTQHLALVLISAPPRHEGTGSSAERTLGSALGLTPAETRLALGLAHGLTVKELAQQHAISWHTARTHVRNILHKTRLKRQGDLMRFLQDLLGY